jgi:hypothetical protein
MFSFGYPLSLGLTLIAVHQHERAQARLLEIKAEQLRRKAMDDARYPHLIDGEVIFRVERRAPTE